MFPGHPQRTTGCYWTGWVADQDNGYIGDPPALSTLWAVSEVCPSKQARRTCIFHLKNWEVQSLHGCRLAAARYLQWLEEESWQTRAAVIYNGMGIRAEEERIIRAAQEGRSIAVMKRRLRELMDARRRARHLEDGVSTRFLNLHAKATQAEASAEREVQRLVDRNAAQRGTLSQ